MQITSRDIEIKTFLEKGFVADTKVLNDLYFHHLTICQRRLTKLSRGDFIKRYRKYPQESYVYYTKETPTNIEKELMKTKIVAQFKNSSLKILDYYSNYDLVRLTFEILIIVETPNQKTVALLFIVRNTGEVRKKRLEEAFKNKDECRLMFNQLRELAPINSLMMVVCAPKPIDTRAFKYHYIDSEHIEEHTKQLIQQLENETL